MTTIPIEDAGSVLVCIPTFNEIENINLIVPAVLKAVPQVHILVIDDNSPDGTGQAAELLAKHDMRVHVLHRSKKSGLGRAYLAGFDWALERGYEFIIEFDADFSHDPKYLPTMIQLLHKVDVVVGSRRVKGGGVENWEWHRRLISWGGSFYARCLLGVGIRDLTGGFNGFRASYLKKLDFSSIQSSGYLFQIEMKYRASQCGVCVEEFPIIFPDRERGVSKMNSSIFGEAFFGVLKLRFS